MSQIELIGRTGTGVNTVYTTAEVISNKLATNSLLSGTEQGTGTVRPLLTDASGFLVVGVGGYTDLSDLTTHTESHISAEGDFFFVSPKATQTFSGTLTQFQDTTTFDLGRFTTLRIWGTSSTNNELIIECSSTLAGAKKRIDTILPISIGGTFAINKYIPTCPGFIRIHNANAISATLDIYFEFSN